MTTITPITKTVSIDKPLDIQAMFSKKKRKPSSVTIVMIPHYEDEIDDNPDWTMPPPNHDQILAQARKDRENGETYTTADVFTMLQKRGSIQ